ncbi:MAG: extracellular solute-binding protein [Hyphomicrobiaceae bacterium]
MKRPGRAELAGEPGRRTARPRKGLEIGRARPLLALVAVSITLLVLFRAELPARAADETILTIVSWGGAYAESQRKAYFEPYMALTPDVKIDVVNAGGEQVKALREQARSGVVDWDLVDVTAADAIRLCREGIALPIDHDKVLRRAPDETPASQDFGQTIVSPCFIPEIVYSTTFGYRTDKVPETPTSLCDVFDLQRFPGKRALERRPINNLEWALICDGVPADTVYQVLDTEEGVAQALHKLATIRNDVVWWTDGNEPVEWLAKGEVVFASAYNGRLFDLITRPPPKPAKDDRKSKKRKKAEPEPKPVPVAILWDRQVFDFDGWIIPRGTTKLQAVLDFVRFATDTERLADQARYIAYGPARRSSTPLVGTNAETGIDMKPFMPTSPENARTTLIYNYDWWAQNRDRMDKRFREWLAE